MNVIEVSGEGSRTESVDPLPPVATEAPWGLSGAILVPLLSFFGQIALATVIGGLVFVLLRTLDPGLIDDPDELWRISLLVSILPVAIASSLLTLGLIWISVTAVWRRPFLRALGIERPTGKTGIWGAAGGGVAVAFLGLVAFFPPDPDRTPGPLTQLAQSGPVGHALWAVLAIVIAPVVEEILFRGYAFRGARLRLGPWGAGALVSLVFVGLHVSEAGLYWPALAGIGTMAVLLVLVMERTGNLTHCIACHVGYNGVLAIVTFIGGIRP